MIQGESKSHIPIQTVLRCIVMLHYIQTCILHLNMILIIFYYELWILLMYEGILLQ